MSLAWTRLSQDWKTRKFRWSGSTSTPEELWNDLPDALAARGLAVLNLDGGPPIIDHDSLLERFLEITPPARPFPEHPDLVEGVPVEAPAPDRARLGRHVPQPGVAAAERRSDV